MSEQYHRQLLPLSMRAKEPSDLLNRSGFQLRRLAPRKHRDLSVRAE